MSIEVSKFYWDQCTNIKGSDRLLIIALADYCNESGWCFPSVPELARRCRLSDRGTQKILARLAAGGHIAVEANGGRCKTSGSATHKYHLLAYQRSLISEKGEQTHSPCVAENGEQIAAKGEPASSLLKGEQNTQKGEQITAKGEQNAQKGELAGSPEPMIHIDPNTNNATRARPAFPPAPSKPSAAAPPATPSDYQKVVKVYHNEIGFITPIIEDEIKTELTRSSLDWVLRAIGVAAMRNHRRWAYVAGILRRWHAEGYDGGVDNRSVRTPNAAGSGSKSRGYGRQMAPAMRAKGQSIEDYADDPEYYAQLKALYAGGSAAGIAAD
jgi:DnaD/phage-associated family protein